MSTFYIQVTNTGLSASASDKLEVFGTNNGGETADIGFDRGINRQTRHNVLVAKFGDGYEQRVGDGINTKQESFAVVFSNRTTAEINVLSSWVDSKIGDNFSIVVAGTSVKVACEEYTIQYVNTNVQTLNATFRRVYEP